MMLSAESIILRLVWSSNNASPLRIISFAVGEVEAMGQYFILGA